MDSPEAEPVKRQDLVQALRETYEIVIEADIPERFEAAAYELILRELLEYESE
jgi:hypothetical protein